MIQAILTDIEGTTSSIRFVKDVLFPYARKQSLNVPLLADEDLAVSKRYGVTAWLGPLARFTELEDVPGGRYIMRAIFVVDGEGIVRYRHVSRTGASFQSVDDLERAVASVTA